VFLLLSANRIHGYQIIKDISSCVEISESTLYPILKRLEVSGCVTTYSMEHNSRLRKYYSITNNGRQHIYDFLAGWQELEEIHQFIIREGKS
jgi:PadR family transcriptional regulator PadR